MPLFHDKSGKKGLLYKGTVGEASAKIPEYDLSKIKDSRLLYGTASIVHAEADLSSAVPRLHVLGQCLPAGALRHPAQAEG